MRKITYILIALILLISLTTINVLAGNIDKAKIGQKMFESNIKSGEIVINNNEDDSFKELDAIIGDNEVSDEEMSEVVGEVHTRMVEGNIPWGGQDQPGPQNIDKKSWWQKVKERAKKLMWDSWTGIQFNKPHDVDRM